MARIAIWPEIAAGGLSSSGLYSYGLYSYGLYSSSPFRYGVYSWVREMGTWSCGTTFMTLQILSSLMTRSASDISDVSGIYLSD